MSEKVTNDLILRNLRDMHRKIDDFRGEMNDFRRETTDRLAAMREHIGAQQFDIATLYNRVDYLSDQIERIKAQLPPRPLEH